MKNQFLPYKRRRTTLPSKNTKHRIHGIVIEYKYIFLGASTPFALFCHELNCLDKECLIRIIKMTAFIYIGGTNGTQGLVCCPSPCRLDSWMDDPLAICQISTHCCRK